MKNFLDPKSLAPSQRESKQSRTIKLLVVNDIPEKKCSCYVGRKQNYAWNLEFCTIAVAIDWIKKKPRKIPKLNFRS